jgi:hypothetical protein
LNALERKTRADIEVLQNRNELTGTGIVPRIIVNGFLSEGETMREALATLLEAAKKIEPTAEQREEQRRSFAYGNTAFENKLITREMVDREAEKLAKEKREREE